MVTSAEKAVGLTDYIFKLPGTGKMLAFTLVSSLLITLSSSFAGIWTKNSSINIGSIALTLLCSLALTLIFSFLISIKSKKIKFKQVLATYIVSNIVFSIFLLLTFFAPELSSVGMGLLFIMWFLIARLVFGQAYKAPMIAGLYFIFQIPLALFFSSNIILFILSSVIACISFLAGLFVIFWMINAPVKRIFGVTGISLVSMFFAQWLRGTKELEDIFAKFAENVKTNVDVICFRKIKGKGELTTFIVPHIHFGPFGNLGGSAFPHLIANKFRTSKYDHTFVFHGTATHDFNPIRSNDVEKIISSAREAVKEIKFESKAYVFHGKGDECSVSGITSDNSGIFMLTHAPKVTEDIDFSIGLALKSHAEKFVNNAVIIDAHNAETGDLTHVESGSPLVFDYYKAIENSFGKKLKQENIELGTSSFYPHLNAMGSAGIKIALFRIDGKGKTGKNKFCIILMDANGITPGFRNRILAAIRDKGIDGEICTTDTHSVNVVKGVLNPIGAGMSTYEMELFVHDILDSIKQAEKNLAKVEFGMESKTIEIDVFGPKRAAELVGTANSIAAVLKWAAPTILIACGAASYLLIKLL